MATETLIHEIFLHLARPNMLNKLVIYYIEFRCTILTTVDIRNVSGDSLHQILNDRFSISRLFGKMANIDTDLSKDALQNIGILKKLTGGDLIRAEDKFMP
jgi:hypothetical protein